MIRQMPAYPGIVDRQFAERSVGFIAWCANRMQQTLFRFVVIGLRCHCLERRRCEFICVQPEAIEQNSTDAQDGFSLLLILPCARPATGAADP